MRDASGTRRGARASSPRLAGAVQKGSSISHALEYNGAVDIPARLETRREPGGVWSHATVESWRKDKTMPAEVGDYAPDFTLSSVNEGNITLSQYRGNKHVVLSFHVLDFTPG